MGNQYVTSMISRVEVNRSVNRINISLLDVASDVLNQFRFSEVSVTILRIAEHFGPQITLKSLDAIHMATVITLGENVYGESTSVGQPQHRFLPHIQSRVSLKLLQRAQKLLEKHIKYQHQAFTFQPL